MIIIFLCFFHVCCNNCLQLTTCVAIKFLYIYRNDFFNDQIGFFSSHAVDVLYSICGTGLKAVVDDVLITD